MMTVKELMERLSTLDPDIEIYVSVNNNDGLDIENIADDGFAYFIEVTDPFVV